MSQPGARHRLAVEPLIGAAQSLNQDPLLVHILNRISVVVRCKCQPVRRTANITRPKMIVPAPARTPPAAEPLIGAAQSLNQDPLIVHIFNRFSVVVRRYSALTRAPSSRASHVLVRTLGTRRRVSEETR